MSKIKGIFCHIAKTAGTSQIEIINKYNDLIVLDLRTWIRYLDTNPNANVDNIFLWSFTRHPLDRIVSIYGAWQHKGRNMPLEYILQLAKLGESLDWKIAETFNASYEIIESNFWQESDMAILQHLVPSYIRIERCEEVLNKKMDFVGKFENLENDWEYVCSQLNINDKLPKRNQSSHKTWAEYFQDTDLRNLAYKIYKQDFIQFKYQ